MQVEKWQMHYGVVALQKVDGKDVLATMAETVEEEAATQLFKYYEARGIQTIVVKLEVKF